MWHETLKALRRWLLAAALCFAYLVLLSECDRTGRAGGTRGRHRRSARAGSSRQRRRDEPRHRAAHAV